MFNSQPGLALAIEGHQISYQAIAFLQLLNNGADCLVALCRNRVGTPALGGQTLPLSFTVSGRPAVQELLTQAITLGGLEGFVATGDYLVNPLVLVSREPIHKIETGTGTNYRIYLDQSACGPVMIGTVLQPAVGFIDSKGPETARLRSSSIPERPDWMTWLASGGYTFAVASEKPARTQSAKG